MATGAFTGVGTTFQRWSGQQWEIIAEVKAITGPSVNRNTIDVTSLDTDEGSKEFISGFRQGGEVTLAMNFSRGTYELMKEDFEFQYHKDYAIVFADDDGTYLEFYGLVSNLPIAAVADDVLSANITIVITGELEFGSGDVSAGVSEDPESAPEYSSYDPDFIYDETNDVILDELGVELIEEL